MIVLNWFWFTFTYLWPFLFVLSVVVFFHELGHFLVGRACGVKADAFSIGFGPEIFGYVDGKGTRWRLALLPLGGYVKFHGDATGASTPDREAIENMPDAERSITFAAQKIWKRALIVIAGPAANFVLAIVIFTATIFAYGQAVLSPRVQSVMPGQAAAAAGFKPGDLVRSIDGKSIDSWEDMQRIVQNSAGEKLTIVVRRGNHDVTLVAAPQYRVIKTFLGKSRVALLGLNGSNSPKDLKIKYYNLPQSAARAVDETWRIVARTGSFVGQVFEGRQSADQISGPVGIARISGEVAKIGFGALLDLAAILSISIGLVNLAPVPLLDGGHLLYYALEALRGRPLSERAQELGFRVGLCLVLALMIFATFNDILHLTRS